MIFRIHDDASYLFVIRAHSWSGGHHYLSDNSDEPPKNGAINTICNIIGNVMESVAEAEIGSIYINAQDIVNLQTCRIDMGHTQPPTKLQIDNTTAEAFSKGTLKKKHQKL